MLATTTFLASASSAPTMQFGTAETATAPKATTTYLANVSNVRKELPTTELSVVPSILLTVAQIPFTMAGGAHASPAFITSQEFACRANPDQSTMIRVSCVCRSVWILTPIGITITASVRTITTTFRDFARSATGEPLGTELNV